MFDKKEQSERKADRVRLNVSGTHDRPRLSVRFSNKHVYAQCVDNLLWKTLVFLSTTNKDIASQKFSPNLSGAAVFGKLFGEKAVGSGIINVVLIVGRENIMGT